MRDYRPFVDYKICNHILFSGWAEPVSHKVTAKFLHFWFALLISFISYQIIPNLFWGIPIAYFIVFQVHCFCQFSSLTKISRLKYRLIAKSTTTGPKYKKGISIKLSGGYDIYEDGFRRNSDYKAFYKCKNIGTVKFTPFDRGIMVTIDAEDIINKQSFNDISYEDIYEVVGIYSTRGRHYGLMSENYYLPLKPNHHKRWYQEKYFNPYNDPILICQCVTSHNHLDGNTGKYLILNPKELFRFDVCVIGDVK